MRYDATEFAVAISNASIQTFYMSASTPIAMLVETMLANGLEHEAIVLAVQKAEKSLRARPAEQRSSRGTRLPEDWRPEPSDVAYATAFRMPDTLIALEAQKFKNYWRAKAGAGATKRDWSATWRNWILNVMERRHDAAARQSGSRLLPVTGRPTAGADAVLAGMGRLARRLADNRDAAQSGNGQAGADSDAPRQLGFEPNAKS
jgi:hypothetical protein